MTCPTCGTTYEWAKQHGLPFDSLGDLCPDKFHDTPPPQDDLLKILTRYEGAVNECEGQGDDSDEAVKELEEARAALLDVLRKALAKL